MNVFQRDESKSVQAASLLPLISLLQLLTQNDGFFTFSMDWNVARVFLKEYPKAKSSGTCLLCCLCSSLHRRR